jgi:DNA primase
MADKADIQEIKARLDIVTVVGKYVELKKAGRTWMGLCPFHNEKTPSFHVNQQLGMYKCFGCGKTGDIFTFIQELEHIDFPEALEKLARDAGVTLRRTHDDAQAKKIARLRQITEFAAVFFSYMLNKHDSGKAAKEYAEKQRKLSPETVEKFRIGFAPKQYTLLQTYLQKKGFTMDEITEAGLINEKKSDKFVNRLMFSLFDNNGTVTGFSGRVFAKGDERPKYLNSPETPIFKKRFMLFGLFQAKESIIKQDRVIICEGQIDVISSHQAGITNIVAPLGTSLTETQVGMLAKFTKNLYFALDNDEAGRKSTIRGVQIALSFGAIPFLVRLPTDVKDIDELVQKDPKKWEECITNAQEYISYKINELEKILRTDFALFEKELAQFLETISFAPELKQSIIIKELSQKIHIDEDVLRQSVHKAPLIPLQQEGIQQRQGVLTTAEYILSLMLYFPLLALMLGALEKNGRYFTAPAHKKLYTNLYQFAYQFKSLITDQKDRIKKGLSWSIIFAEFQKISTEQYRDFIRETQQDDELQNLIMSLGIISENTALEVTDDMVKDFMVSLRRLKKSVVSLELQKLQGLLSQAEMQKDKPRIKELEVYMQELLTTLRKLEKK